MSPPVMPDSPAVGKGPKVLFLKTEVLDFEKNMRVEGSTSSESSAKHSNTDPFASSTLPSISAKSPTSSPAFAQAFKSLSNSGHSRNYSEPKNIAFELKEPTFSAPVSEPNSPKMVRKASDPGTIGSQGMPRLLAASDPRVHSEMTLSFFKKHDRRCREQQLLLKDLFRMTRDKSQSAGNKKFKNKTGKYSPFMKPKKLRSTPATLHLLRLTVHDRLTMSALTYVDALSSKSLRQKYPHFARNIFLLAMLRRMEKVCLELMDKGFPADFNAPIFEKDDFASYHVPSYFIAAITLKLELVVAQMLKRVNVNQTWNGLSALAIACFKGSPLLVNQFLKAGANTNQLISSEAYQTLLGLKGIFLSYAGTSTRTPGQKSTSNKVLDLKSDDVFSSAVTFTILDIASASGNPEVVQQLVNECSVETLARSSLSVFVTTNMLIILMLLKAGIPLGNATILYNQPVGNHVSLSLISTSQSNEARRTKTPSEPTPAARLLKTHTPLTYAASRGNIRLVIALIQNGLVDINGTGRDGNTALHEAVLAKRRHVVHYLIVSNASTTVRNNAGLSCIDIIQDHSYSGGIIMEDLNTRQLSPPLQQLESLAQKIITRIRVVTSLSESTPTRSSPSRPSFLAKSLFSRRPRSHSVDQSSSKAHSKSASTSSMGTTGASLSVESSMSGMDGSMGSVSGGRSTTASPSSPNSRGGSMDVAGKLLSSLGRTWKKSRAKSIAGEQLTPLAIPNTSTNEPTSSPDVFLSALSAPSSGYAADTETGDHSRPSSAGSALPPLSSPMLPTPANFLPVREGISSVASPSQEMKKSNSKFFKLFKGIKDPPP